MNKTPTREEVAFKSCKSKDGSELEFDMYVKVSDGGKTAVVENKATWPFAPAPDLTNRLQQLKTRLIENFGYAAFSRLIDNPDFKATKEQAKILKAWIDDIKSEIRVTGISYLGKENIGVTIKGTYDGSPINTKIYFENPDYGAEMETLVKEIADEVYEYVYNNKRLQLTAFDN